jgi:hypothetical protein
MGLAPASAVSTLTTHTTHTTHTTPVEDLAASLYSALLKDLPAVQYQDRDWQAWNRISALEQKERARRAKLGDRGAIPMVARRRRPRVEEVCVDMFMQTWRGANALAAAADQEAVEGYVVVVEGPQSDRAVYFGGKLVYFVLPTLPGGSVNKSGMAMFLADIKEKRLAGPDEAFKRYGALRTLRIDPSDKPASSES